MPDPASRQDGHDVAALVEAVLDLRDQLIGVQAQLDELRIRVDEVERSLPSAPRRRLARIRTRVGLARGSSTPSTPS